MARPQTFQSTRRSRVRSSDAPNQLRRTMRPVITDYGTDGAAQDLAKAMGVVPQAVETGLKIRDQKAKADANLDVTQGTVDEERREANAAYDKHVSRLEAKSNWILDQKEFDEQLRGLDLASMSGEELNAQLDNLFKKKYAGLDNEHAAQLLVPAMQEYRAQKQEELVELQKRKVQQKLIADNSVIFEDAVDNLESPDEIEGVLRGLQQNIRKSGFTGPETNAAMFSLLQKEAVARGMPELLENIPDKWDNGVPTFKHIPEYMQRLQNAKVQARSVQQQRINAQEAALEDAREEDFAEKGLEIARMILNPGIDPENTRQMISSLARHPGAKFSTIMSMFSNMRSARDDFESRVIDFEALGSFTEKIHRGEAGYSDVLAALSDGTFGRGEAAEERFKYHMSLVKQVKKSNDSGNGSLVTQARGRVKDIFVSSMFDIDKSIPMLEAEATRKFDDLVYEEGMDPMKARDQVIEEYQQHVERITNTNAEKIKARDPEYFTSTYFSMDADKRSEVGPRFLREMDIDVSYVDRLVKMDAVTDDQARELYNALPVQ